MSIPPLDAWALARLRAGHVLNGQADRLTSDSNRVLARRMASLPTEDRARVWDEYLAALPEDEAVALISAVAKINPADPPPEGEPWEPLRLKELPAVEPFPDIVLPDRVADFVRVVSDSIGCPPDFVGLSVLVVAGAAIGRSASLMLKPGYFASASLYGMNIGGPSSGKSPAQAAAVQPMWSIDEELHESYKVEKERYEGELAKASSTPKGQPKPEPPAKPVLKSAVLEDCTVEAMAPHLAINQRGLLVSRDEGSAWVASLNQYKSGGKGSDRQFWLSALFGKPVRVDRKGNPDTIPIRVPHPFLSFIGGMPPDMLVELRERGGRSDGFVERILFAFPDPSPRPHWSDDGIPDETQALWSEIVRRLRSRTMTVSGGKTHPQVFRLAPEAKAAWVGWYNAHADMVNTPDFDASELATEGKLCDFAARLALILHLLHLACDPIAEDPDRPPYVSKWAVAGAIKLWGYFRSHHRRARAYLEGRDNGAPKGARFVLRWIRNHRDVTAFPESELTRTVPQLREDRAMMGDGLCWLEQRKAIRRLHEPDRPKGTRGRKPASVWEVHPELRDKDNAENTEKSRSERLAEPEQGNCPYSPYSPNPVSGTSQEGGDDGMHAF